eukprot:GHVU01201724.1.p1 GENE.GHVU01201724.1~~GHVU01201724.1.p1  ORF type:complete len:293 (-),score=10.92 GHVU01201724.1:652-1530(-)
MRDSRYPLQFRLYWNPFWSMADTTWQLQQDWLITFRKNTQLCLLSGRPEGAHRRRSPSTDLCGPRGHIDGDSRRRPNGGTALPSLATPDRSFVWRIIFLKKNQASPDWKKVEIQQEMGNIEMGGSASSNRGEDWVYAVRFQDWTGAQSDWSPNSLREEKWYYKAHIPGLVQQFRDHLLVNNENADAVAAWRTGKFAWDHQYILLNTSKGWVRIERREDAIHLLVTDGVSWQSVYDLCASGHTKPWSRQVRGARVTDILTEEFLKKQISMAYHGTQENCLSFANAVERQVDSL